MKRLVPDSIAGRTILVLLVGLTLSHLLSMAVYHRDLLAALGLSGDRHIAERVASISRAIAELPPADRERTAHAASNQSLEAHWDQAAAIGAGADEAAPGLRQRIALAMPELPLDGIMTAHAAQALPGHGNSTTMIAVHLDDGSWVNFRVAAQPPAVGGSQHLLVSTSLMAAAVLLFSSMLVRLLTAPLRDLSRAAERLGLDMTAPPLAETGPREVRQAARAFNNMQSRLRRLVTDRTQMLAAISHDLRTPITRLRLRAELAEEGQQRSKILADLQEMEAMVASVLAFIREDGDREEARVVDIAALLATVCDDMMDAGCAIRFDGGCRPALRCRPLAMKRALTNLLDNAVKYGSEAVVSLSSEAGALRIDIDDSGPGIPEPLREKVFSPFYRAEVSRNRGTGGTGLGLTVARSIIRAHGGDIDLSESPMKGLRVTAWLPQAIPS